MPGRGNAGHMRGKHEKRQAEPPAPGTDPSTGPTTSPGGTVGSDGPGGPGRSDWSPGHMKKAAGVKSARDFAPGHGGTPPGQRGDGQDEGETLT